MLSEPTCANAANVLVAEWLDWKGFAWGSQTDLQDFGSAERVVHFVDLTTADQCLGCCNTGGKLCFIGMTQG
jgi:hypothetical protein